MFTGLIETLGTVNQTRRQGDSLHLQIEADIALLDGVNVGDSINVDGACQTIVAVGTKTFTVESISETLLCTNLGDLLPGDAVNLERPMRLQDRLDGHLLIGHVDGVGQIMRLQQTGHSWVLEVKPPVDLLRFVAAKGSIAVSGISLTIVDVNRQSFPVSIIPHTFEITTLSRWQTGKTVNIEVDVIARYLDRLMAGSHVGSSELTLQKLRDLGY